MFNPRYTISPLLLENIKKITLLVAELNGQRFPKPVLVELERRAREISAYSSTSIEGNPLPLTEVKQLLKNVPSSMRDSEREVLNYNRVLRMLNGRMEEKKMGLLDRAMILKIHKGVMQGLISTSRCGLFREEPVFVNNPRLKRTVYWPPDAKEVPLLMKELVSYLHKNARHLDPLILAGIFHKQFVIIHPFADGNGRTARLATKVVLAMMGLNTFNLFSFENYYNKNVTRYFEQVGVLGNYYDVFGSIDFTPWLEYFTEGIIDELLRVKKILEREFVDPSQELKPYHQKMIRFIEETGYITDAHYAKLVNRAKATRSLDFKTLMERGVIQRLGKGKNTYYKTRASASSPKA